MVCPQDNVAGVQFDIEPFDISQPGQYYFYSAIAKMFSTMYPCVDPAHPNGRYFSIFGFAGQFYKDPTDAQNYATNVFNYGGKPVGYFIDSLYDVANDTDQSNPPTSPTAYPALAGQELYYLENGVSKLGIYYQVAIPAAASVHEFEVGYVPSQNGVVFTGYQQNQYVQEAVNLLKSGNSAGQYAFTPVVNDPHFLGTDVWGWAQLMSNMANNGNVYNYEPSTPMESLSYLAQNIPVPQSSSNR